MDEVENRSKRNRFRVEFKENNNFLFFQIRWTKTEREIRRIETSRGEIDLKLFIVTKKK